MLIEFRAENYRSLRDEQALTMEAGRVGEPSDPRPRKVEGYGEKLLPAAALYGANASGKSNVLAAFGFMREAILFSHRLWEPGGGVPRLPFAWGEKRNEPSLFEATLLLDGIKYAYGFVVGDEAVEEEWLFAWPNNRKQVWFEREGDKFKFGEHLKGPNESVKEVTRPNALFLSVASQHRHEQLSAIYSWFIRVAGVNVAGRSDFVPPSWSIPEWHFLSLFFEVGSLFPDDESEEILTTRMRHLLNAADIGIVDVKIVESEEDVGERQARRRRMLMQHQPGNDDSWLSLEDESAGTKTLFRMAPAVFRALTVGGFVLVDELESSLHPLLGLAIVRLFNNPETNPKNAQIVFTTHDTNLLGGTVGEPPLRRDQIWFTEKDKDGATTLYPLTDYKPRKAENLERGYLQGRYGAIPFLGNIGRITE